MKDTHNIILVLVSSKWLIPSSGVCSWYQILCSKLFIFSFWSSKLFQLYHFKASSNHCKDHLVLSTSLHFYHSSITGVLTEVHMVVHQGFFSFFNCSSRFPSESGSVKLYSKINMVLNTCLSWGVQAFFILHSEVQFFLLSFEVVLCHSWQFEFAFHDSHVVKNEIF